MIIVTGLSFIIKLIYYKTAMSECLTEIYFDESVFQLNGKIVIIQRILQSSSNSTIIVHCIPNYSGLECATIIIIYQSFRYNYQQCSRACDSEGVNEYARVCVPHAEPICPRKRKRATPQDPPR